MAFLGQFILSRKTTKAICTRALVLTVFAGATVLGFQLARGQEAPDANSQPNLPPGTSGIGVSPNGDPIVLPAPNTPPSQQVPQPQMPPSQMNGGAQVQPPSLGQPVSQSAPSYPAPQANPNTNSRQNSNSPSNDPKNFVPSEVETILPAIEVVQNPKVTLKTAMGPITVELNVTDAPKISQNFLDLVRGEKEFVDVKTSKKAKRPYYNGLFFHRTVAGVVIQGGCPFGTGRGGPGYVLDDEINPRMKFDRPGLLAMAAQREGTKVKGNTNGSQFFITLKEMPEWDGKFTIFGEVVKGLDVVDKISRVKIGPTERPIRRVYLNTAEVVGEKPKALETTEPAQDEASSAEPVLPAPAPGGAPVSPDMPPMGSEPPPPPMPQTMQTTPPGMPQSMRQPAPGMMPPGSMPPGSMPPGSIPPGSMPPQQMQPPRMPSQMPQQMPPQAPPSGMIPPPHMAPPPPK